MSKYYSLLFIWTKGAKIRREIVKIVFSYQEKNEAIFLSKITNDLIEKYTEKKVTISLVRFHLKSLEKYNLIESINKGGRPEYLSLTREGLDAFNRIIEENGKLT
ncbi:MAG: hypothetical protein HeimC3_09340 [Candidatus Heimdallarchaeota archaeon LC_3]|nr:MAG: hypothetical protein HeimC3_09340 [Candidatus Heimdallarchaeota archaeon LC_3]